MLPQQQFVLPPALILTNLRAQSRPSQSAQPTSSVFLLSYLSPLLINIIGTTLAPWCLTAAIYTVAGPQGKGVAVAHAERKIEHGTNALASSVPASLEYDSPACRPADPMGGPRVCI